ncbi:CDP-alcohol phosphatidyltransferase family protein [Fusibacter ferrireducens]|uniref:CDP-alcohol phosphatidyltransferase family protein n=1 Tax=Fusibacter ferrireducens TaxID=2785058 RepID=A0ABR9ZRE5_9FIRM|nr:CDP-alcohol phosphatidyltransferase family protein [Fusibacter ferrireducens]MBF4692551.1 CDP-alcohol phosphatidyltransferase family protein [Fusibacter ferrireducens]
MKLIVNIISLSRILMALSLLKLEPFSTAFYLVYIFCGLSDIVDGYIARKTNSTSELGAKLDSFADLIMILVVMAILIPILEIPMAYIIWIFIIICIRFAAFIIAVIKYRKFGSLHTIANKATGLMLFLYPLIRPFDILDFAPIGLCLMGTLSAIEELIIHLKFNKLILNRKSLFDKKRDL